MKCPSSITRAFALGFLLSIFITLAGCDLVAGDVFAAWLLASLGFAVTTITAKVSEPTKEAHTP